MVSQPAVATVAARLGLGPEYAGWLEFLEATGAPPGGVALPEGDAAEALLREIGLDEPDLSVILAERLSPGATRRCGGCSNAVTTPCGAISASLAR